MRRRRASAALCLRAARWYCCCYRLEHAANTRRVPVRACVYSQRTGGTCRSDHAGWDTMPGGIPCRVGYHAGWDTMPGGICAYFSVLAADWWHVPIRYLMSEVDALTAHVGGFKLTSQQARPCTLARDRTQPQGGLKLTSQAGTKRRMPRLPAARASRATCNGHLPFT
jgi:hypothetical protein